MALRNSMFVTCAAGNGWQEFQAVPFVEALVEADHLAFDVDQQLTP